MGIPVVQMANIVSIAKTIGANRIVPTVAIPHPLGDPLLSETEQRKLRHHRVGIALDSLKTNIEETTIFEVKE
ncbi:glycine reductase [Texcoconibacillus texcoconensis]|nr:glycine reductase [Texcoconibacillus texcoconensis]